LKISIFLLSIGRLRQTGCSPSFGRYGSCGLLKHDYKEMASQADGARFMAAARLEVAPRLHHVRVVDETRRTHRHHGKQRDAPRRIVTFRHATLRVATHRYATLEPLGKPGGSRAFSADAPLGDAYRSQPEEEN
jgi:hypothetical protein